MPKFNPYPIVNQEQFREPTYDELVNRPIQQGLGSLVQLDQQRKQKEQADFARALEMARFKGEYGESGMSDLLNSAQPKPRPFNSIMRPQQGPTLADPSAGTEGMDPAQVQRQYGSRGLKMFQAARDRDLDRQYKESQINLNNKKLSEPGEREKKRNAKSRVTGNLQQLKTLYEKLDRSNAIVNTDDNAAENLIASARSSGVGQTAGRIFGTDDQSIRNQINQIRPLLLQDIRQASEMGARGLDSEKELEFYLQAATDPKRDVQSNLAALEVLDNAYGLGLGLARKKSVSRGESIPSTETTGKYKYTATGPSGQRIGSNDGQNWEPIK